MKEERVEEPIRSGWNFPEQRLPRGVGFLRMFGPGAILASATIGAGETILAVRAGAWGGYGLLWLILLACLTKSFVLLYFLGRYSALSGDNVAARLKEFPGPPGWLLLFILVADLVPAGPVFAAIATPCGSLIANLIGGSPKIWGIGFALLAIVIAVVQKYDFLEKQQVVVCLGMLACVIAATLMVSPDWLEVCEGLFSFGYVPDVPSWAGDTIDSRKVHLELATVFGYAGNIAMGYVVYADFVRSKKWGVHASENPPPSPDRLPVDEKNLNRARRCLVPIWGDLMVTSLLIFVVTASFLVAGAAILKPLGQLPKGFNLLSTQAEIFRAVSVYLVPVYYIAILFALWGTLNSLPEIYGRVTHSFLGALFPRWFSRTREIVVVRTLGIYFALCVVYLIATGTKPMAMIHFVGLYSTNLGVAAAMMAALWLDYRLPRELRAALPMKLLGFGSMVVIFIFSALAAWGQWFG